MVHVQKGTGGERIAALCGRFHTRTHQTCRLIEERLRWWNRARSMIIDEMNAPTFPRTYSFVRYLVGAIRMIYTGSTAPN